MKLSAKSLWPRISFGLLLFFSAFPLLAADLSVGKNDLRIEQRLDGGYHLFIRKKPDINSVLLVESTKDPRLRADNYAYRAAGWNTVNGDERRLLDGKFLEKEKGIWSLLDSSVEPDAEFGQAFHIFIPYLIYFGYEWTRNGEVYVVDGTYFNIRTFDKAWADYTGNFLDNPYVVRVVQAPSEGPPEGNFMPATVESFTGVAKATGGQQTYAEGPEAVVQAIQKLLDAEKGKNLDFVLALDTTASMRDDMNVLRKDLLPMIQSLHDKYPSMRMGLVLYKDYFETYITKCIEFTSDIDSLQSTLNRTHPSGGRDLPEAVHEALFDAADKFDWQAESRLVILLGDAPPHPRPRGEITEEKAYAALHEKNIKVSVIILPH